MTEKLSSLEICQHIADIQGIKDPKNRTYVGATNIEDGAYNPLIDDSLYLRLTIEHELVVRFWQENDVLILQAENCFGEEIGQRLLASPGSELASVKHCGCLGIIELHRD